MEVRQARADDHDDIVAFTSDTWSDRFDRGDYIPEVFPEWVESDGPDQHTVVAEADGRAIGVCQVVALSVHEAWAQGMRVADDARAEGVAAAMNDACFAWARERGATVCRNMVLWHQIVDNCYTTGATESNHDRQDPSQHPGTGGNQVPVGRCA
ncbi:N-acetyltransferase family protein [Halosimplex marinum]|uniref:GNAT family N-acetyltransferase n=1 Tax=Halosimplex marinum TaxID=3396620 RepID=UPI003F567064